MKFPRNAKIFRGHLDVAPFAGVFFCLLMFLVLASLVYTPGVTIHLPVSRSPLSGMEGPTLAVALDQNGRYYFENQVITGTNLAERLRAEARKSSGPVTLVMEADEKATLVMWNRLRDLGVAAGITNIAQEMLPGPFDPPSDPAQNRGKQ